ncbi:hypothetical protein [Streptomyces parvus]|uniref:hypothetical protein n=1 Tax=Streptomyces parvus TaxID=66428 RepID=UPI0033D63FC3
MTPGPGFPALAPHRSGTATLLADAARRRGMEVTVLPVGGVPEPYRGRADAHCYGGPRFAVEFRFPYDPLNHDTARPGPGTRTPRS